MRRSNSCKSGSWFCFHQITSHSSSFPVCSHETTKGRKEVSWQKHQHSTHSNNQLCNCSTKKEVQFTLLLAVSVFRWETLSGTWTHHSGSRVLPVCSMWQTESWAQRRFLTSNQNNWSSFQQQCGPGIKTWDQSGPRSQSSNWSSHTVLLSLLQSAQLRDNSTGNWIKIWKWRMIYDSTCWNKFFKQI